MPSCSRPCGRSPALLLPPGELIYVHHPVLQALGQVRCRAGMSCQLPALRKYHCGQNPGPGRAQWYRAGVGIVACCVCTCLCESLNRGPGLLRSAVLPALSMHVQSSMLLKHRLPLAPVLCGGPQQAGEHSGFNSSTDKQMHRGAVERSEDLDCILCLKLLYEPVTTPCGHTFCRPCFLRAFDHSSKYGLLQITAARCIHGAASAVSS